MPRNPSTGDYHPEGPDDRTAAEQAEADVGLLQRILREVFEAYLSAPTIENQSRFENARLSYHEAWITHKARKPA